MHFLEALTVILWSGDRVKYAETLCLGLVSLTVLYMALPLFRASGAILSQMAPSGTTAAALNKCLRQVRNFLSMFKMPSVIVLLKYVSFPQDN